MALLLAASLSGCGSDSTNTVSNLPGALAGFNPGDVYQGFVLGRVKLPQELQQGTVEITTMDGQVLYQVMAADNGFFYYRGYLPPDCRLRAKRGNDVYETEHHGAWKGGTLYINVGTTLSAAYHRSHPQYTLEQAEARIKSYYGMPPEVPMSWVSTARIPGFDPENFYNKVRAQGLASYLAFLGLRIDSMVLAEASPVKDILGFTYDTFVAPAVQTAYGDSVANMGFNFTTAGALNNIEDALAAVSQQLTDLSNAVAKNAAAAALQSDLQPLSNNSLQINNAVANITNTAIAFQATHPSSADYGVPSSYPAIQDTIGQVQSLNLSNLTDPIAANITNAGLYNKLVNQQMLDIAQPSGKYVWRSNQLTEAQLQMIGSYATALGQSAYLEAEYANVQFGQLAQALNLARQNMDERAYQIQLASQPIPDMFPSDEVLFDTESKLMWFSANMGWYDEPTARAFMDNLEVANYRDWGFPTEDQIKNTIISRVLPATGTPSATEWSDLGKTVWQDAFELMGFDMRIYSAERGGTGSNNYGCWYNTGSYSSDTTNVTLRFFEWDGTNRNPSSSDPGSGTGNATPATNTLAVRRFGLGPPETNAAVVVIPPFNYSSHQQDSTQADNHSASFTQHYQSPFQLAFPSNFTLNYEYENDLGKGYQCISEFLTGAIGSNNTSTYWSSDGKTSGGGYYWDVTTRVAWSVDRPDLCRVSNYSTASDDQQYGAGFVTWYPNLDGTPITDPVTLKAEWLTMDPTDYTGGKMKMNSLTRSITPQDGYKPYLDQVYAIPQNQVYDVSGAPTTVRMTAIATYKDGRAIDVSQDATWTLTDASTGQTLNSSATGGFQVVAGQAVNDLYLTGGLPSNDVKVTMSYTNQWADSSSNTTFSTQLRVIKAPPVINNLTPAFGPSAGGNIIRINGSGFTEGSIAYFGNTPATSTFFVTANQLTVTVPPGNVGAVAVRVVTASSQTQNSANYNYTN
jgi:hypothetical protein